MLDALRNVAKLCAVAAMTAPKSGGQLFLKGSKPFIETVIVEEIGIASGASRSGCALRGPSCVRRSGFGTRTRPRSSTWVSFIGLAEAVRSAG